MLFLLLALAVVALSARVNVQEQEQGIKKAIEASHHSLRHASTATKRQLQQCW
jgi:hypothetical protein